ncbi:hypothetical protein J4573_03610 [Actinomadura barringtoniae]|uniref:Uncharacterized protein n=1 Tax=Actinomadura barringtoniae TaxID=1427535 RepID=A0A939P6Z7_9ACTN|nr:hypothetical protein [Actinomadura barringtoniae]MBO2446162.1 hypothetical protein [Actinomadura barringtoniae]
MSVVRGEARRRWLIVAALVAVLCSIPFVVAAYPVSAQSPDPARLRQQILASASRPYEGLVESRGSLGLPDLPGLDDSTSLLSGTSRMRAWYASSQRWRVALMTPTGERDLLQSPGRLAIWDYERELLTRVDGITAIRLPYAADLMPPDLARRLLKPTSLTDHLTALSARRVAGRDVPGLRLEPGDQDTTIGRVDVWADPKTGVPVEIQVTARGGARPALATRFLDLKLATPADAAVAPKPAPGVAAATIEAPDLLSRLASRTNARLPDSLAGRHALASTSDDVASVRGYSGGLASFAATPLPGRYGRRVFEAARTAGAGTLKIEGGEALAIQTPLLTAVLARGTSEDDRMFLLAGAVRAEVLRTAAQELIS